MEKKIVNPKSLKKITKPNKGEVNQTPAWTISIWSKSI